MHLEDPSNHHKISCLQQDSSSLPIIYLILIALVLNLALIAPTHADSTLPNPLSIQQAIEKAQQTSINPAQTNAEHIDFTPLYLTCNDIAYPQIRQSRLSNRISPKLLSTSQITSLRTLQQFMDTLLADRAFVYSNEEMASAYIRFDRARTRYELKQTSELTVAELESEYQQIRQRYFSSEATQRLTRSRLAQTLDSFKLPIDLEPIKLDSFPKESPELSELLKKSQNNTYLNKLASEADQYTQRLIQHTLQQELTHLLLRGQMLHIAKQSNKVESYYRDLALERSRTLYEQEVKADLGNSMALQSLTQFHQDRINYCSILTWANIKALLGTPILTSTNKPKGKQ